MSIIGVVKAGRSAAEALMVDTCNITAGVAGQVYDAASDSYVTPAGAARYSGPCRVRPGRAGGREVEAGAATVALWQYVVSVPMSVATIEDDDVVTVTASALDPSLVGKRLRVREVVRGSHVTARRLGCEEQT